MKMKKPILIFIFVILFFNLVLAGRSLNIDFSTNDLQLVMLLEKDRIEFDLVNGTHTIIADEIKENGDVDLDIFPYYETQDQVAYATVGPEKLINIDLNKDHKSDLRVSFYGKSENKTVLLFENLENKNQEIITGEVVREVNGNKFIPYVIIIFLLIISLIIFFFIKKRKFLMKKRKK